MQSTAAILSAGLSLLAATAAGGQTLAPPVDPNAPMALTPVDNATAGDPQKIVNGLITSGFPSVGAVLNLSTPNAPSVWCTGTLIGCQTFLTAAHCVADNPNPASYVVFFQNNGGIPVSAIAIHPAYVEGPLGHDMALLRLAAPAEALEPTPINTIGRLPNNTSGVIAGFGRTGGASQNYGIKRFGGVRTAACQAAADPATSICWDFSLPTGPAGTDSSTCQGDSGGPLFAVTSDGDFVVAGVTSGGNQTCLEPNRPYDSDVYVDRQWIQQTAGPDLGTTSCGPVPPAGSANAPVLGGWDSLTAGQPTDTYTFNVPAGTTDLLITLNAENPFTNDFDLYASPGTSSGPGNGVCEADSISGLEACLIPTPTPGPWAIQASRFSGSGLYQVTATLFLGGSQPTACVPSGTTLCIDDQPGDKRFAAEIAWNRNGALGQAGALPLQSVGVTQGGLFWIGSPTNPEVLLKVLNACGVNNHYWVFYSAGTNQGLEVTVRDTATNRTWTRTNQNGTLAAPVADTIAFPCN